MLARRPLADHLIAVATTPCRRPAPSPYAAILATPIPDRPVGSIADKPRKLQAAALRRLFARLGIDRVRVYCPRDDSSVVVGYEPHPGHPRYSTADCDPAVCPACIAEKSVRRHLDSIVQAAYPDMDGPAPIPSLWAVAGGADYRFYVFPCWRTF